MKAIAPLHERPKADGDLVSWMAGTQLLARGVSLLLYLRQSDEAGHVRRLGVLRAAGDGTEQGKAAPGRGRARGSGAAGSRNAHRDDRRDFAAGDANRR